MSLPVVHDIHQAVLQLAEHLETVDAEELPIAGCAGRILAENLVADRDSPAIDVSAMDGYAIRIADLESNEPLPVAAVNAAGFQPNSLPANSAVRVFTGAGVPPECDCVVKREDTLEEPEQVTIQLAAEQLKRGGNIRRKGENSAQGDLILDAGSEIHSAAIAAVASFGRRSIQVRRRVRIAILNTGDELARAGEPVEDWQIRDSNGPTLSTWLGKLPWVELKTCEHVGDTLEQVEASLQSHLEDCDAIILTGGVSMGDTDYVPKAIENIGGTVHFHRLPLRPGRPVLGAAREGKLLLGLPGNPVSVAVTSRVIGFPLLRKLAGVHPVLSSHTRVTVALADDRQLHLIWYRLVDQDVDGQLGFSTSLGSGDLVSLSRSAGFVEIPAGQSGAGPWPFYAWE
ncbi:MAG: molybdopterin molybdotransferase MoeA [Planctomycetota bacterium]